MGRRQCLGFPGGPMASFPPAPKPPILSRFPFVSLTKKSLSLPHLWLLSKLLGWALGRIVIRAIPPSFSIYDYYWKGRAL